jgi:hypothetical protein
VKRLIKGLSVSLLAVGILGACSEPVEKEKASTTVKTEETKPAPAPVKEPVSTVADDIATYHNQLNDPVNGLSQAMGTFGELNIKAGSDPSLMFTDDWKTDMAVALVAMDKYIGQIRAIDPPDSLDEPHALLLQAMDEYQYVVDNYPKAIDNMDANAIIECTNHMNNGNDLIGQATDKLNSMK